MKLPLRPYGFLTLMLLLLLGSCASSGQSQPALEQEIVPAGEVLPGWPPHDLPGRSASDDSVEVPGSDFDSAGGGAHAVSTVCKLNDGSAPWAIYGMGSFDQVELGSIQVDYNILSGAGTVLYIGMANYQQDRWEWFSTTQNGSFTFIPVNHAHYVSASGNVHIALLRTGPATIDIQKLSFNRIGDISVLTPQNLRYDELTPENTGLLWDPVAGATGYNVFLSRYPDLSSPIQLNTEPVTVPEFDYTPGIRGVIFYYYVTALGTTESAPSDYIDLFAPTIDMPEPQNPRIVESTPDSLIVGWDWDTETYGPEPANGWYVYVKAQKDFNLDPVIFTKYRSSPGHRTATFTGLETGTLYFYRVVGASINSSRGRMTDDLPAITGNYWDWTQASPIANGTEPIRAVATGNEASAVWFDSGSVVFAQGIADNWSADSCGLDAGDEYFSNYLDISERNGNYIVSTYDSVALDLYASTGGPGNWTSEFIADGFTSDPTKQVPAAGHHGDCAVSDDSYAILYKDWYADMTYTQTRPIAGGSWTRDNVRPLTRDYPVGLCIQANGNNMEFLYFDYEAHELLFGAGPAPYSINQISDNQGANIGIAPDLVMTAGGWVSVSYDVTNDDLYLLRQNGSSWDLEDIAVVPGTSSGYGRNARLEPFRDGLLAVFLDDANHWNAAVFDGTEWFQQAMLLPLIQPSTGAELVVVNDVPYFLVRELSNSSPDKGKVICITGVIPAFEDL
ncbi:MAG: fibronectin type III domain-containing protein [bacterium]